MIDIICLIPVWKRPEIFRLCYENNRKYQGKNLIFVYILSPEDPDLQEIEQILNGEIVFFAPNKPLGAKVNAGIEAIIKHFDFKYLMNLGSDDMILSDLYQIYQPYITNQTPIFGFNSCYTRKYNRQEVFELPNANPEHCIGAGRMIRKELLMYRQIYDSAADRGLDTNSMNNLGVKATLIDGIAPIIDIKSNTNLNCFEFLEQQRNIKPLNFDFYQLFRVKRDNPDTV